MNRFRGFVVKEMFHILRDYRTLLILFGMPAVQLMLFGYVLTNEIKDAKIAVYDPSRDAVTTKLTDKILSSGYFILARNLSSVAETEAVFRKGEVKLALIYEQGFAQKLEKNGTARLQIIADASDPNTASILVNYTQGIVSSYLASTNATSVPLRIIPEVRMAYNASLKGVFMFVPGLMAMLLMLISALMTSLSITREKELGTMELLLVSPLRPAQIIIGKVFPYVFLAFIDACIILLLGNLVFGVPVRGSTGLLLMESLLFISMALSLGILISAITSSQQVAMMISLVALMLPTILLSGFIFPIENMPLILQFLCYAMPPTYYIKIVKSIMLQGNGIELIWRETLILAGFTLFFLVLSIRKFNIRLA